MFQLTVINDSKWTFFFPINHVITVKTKASTVKKTLRPSRNHEKHEQKQ
jgi:hypothetical protein